MKVQKVVAYEDGRLDAAFSDKSYIILLGNTLTYYMPTGVQSTIKIKAIERSDPVYQKIRLISTIYNRHSDNFFNLEHEPAAQLTKLKKINFYQWPEHINPMISEVTQGWKIHSLDGNAQVTLHRDLFKITVSYLQDTTQKSIQTVKFEYNSKILLQKYRLPYEDFSAESQKVVVMHKYQRVVKQFCVWAVPDRWKYPCGLLWKNIDIVQEPLFIPDILKEGKTDMPQSAFRQESQGITMSLMPSIRHPKHTHKALWLWSDNCICWFRKEGALFYDNHVYWQCQTDNFHLKLFNTIMSQKIYHVKAIPLVIRLNDYQSEISQQLKLVHAYECHNKSIQQQAIQPQITRQFTQIHQHSDQYASYTAYANGIVRARFIDKTIMTYSRQNIRVVTPQGHTININQNNMQFRDHLQLVLKYYQEIFEPEKSRMREEMSRRLEAQIMANKLRIDIIKSVCK